jgi:hypothetical protein
VTTNELNSREYNKLREEERNYFDLTFMMTTTSAFPHLLTLLDIKYQLGSKKKKSE